MSWLLTWGAGPWGPQGKVRDVHGLIAAVTCLSADCHHHLPSERSADHHCSREKGQLPLMREQVPEPCLAVRRDARGETPRDAGDQDMSWIAWEGSWTSCGALTAALGSSLPWEEIGW